MDKYLTSFTSQLDAMFDPETLFPVKKVHATGWIFRKFGRKRAAIPQIKKLQPEPNFNSGNESTAGRKRRRVFAAFKRREL